MQSLRKPRGRGFERRDEILDAAERLFDQRGPETSLRDIATAAGLSQASLFKHFATRADLTAALRERVQARLERNIGDAPPSSGDVRQELDVILRAHARLAWDRPSIFSLAFPSSLQLAQLDPAGGPHGTLPGMARLRAAFASQAACTGQPRPSLDLMSLSSWFMIYGMALTVAVELGRDRLKAEALISSCLDLLVRQLSALG